MPDLHQQLWWQDNSNYIDMLWGGYLLRLWRERSSCKDIESHRQEEDDTMHALQPTVS